MWYITGFNEKGEIIYQYESRTQMSRNAALDWAFKKGSVKVEISKIKDDICVICGFNISKAKEGRQRTMSHQFPDGKWICGECRDIINSWECRNLINSWEGEWS